MLSIYRPNRTQIYTNIKRARGGGSNESQPYNQHPTLQLSSVISGKTLSDGQSDQTANRIPPRSYPTPTTIPEPFTLGNTTSPSSPPPSSCQARRHSHPAATAASARTAAVRRKIPQESLDGMHGSLPHPKCRHAKPPAFPYPAPASQGSGSPFTPERRHSKPPPCTFPSPVSRGSGSPCTTGTPPPPIPRSCRSGRRLNRPAAEVGCPAGRNADTRTVLDVTCCWWFEFHGRLNLVWALYFFA